MAHFVAFSGLSEPFSSLSHLLGAGFFALLSPLMLHRGRGDLPRLASLVVFCLGAIFLLVVSGAYHLVNLEANARDVLQRLDHVAIFVLIACSFTPIHMILFRGWGRWGTLVLIWAIAAVGIAVKMTFFEQISPPLGTALYIGTGWIGLGSWLAIVRRYGFDFARPIMWGGIAYTAGAILEALHWPVLVPGVVQWHEVFHIAVLIALGFHWAFIYAIAGHASHVRRPGVPREDASCSPSRDI